MRIDKPAPTAPYRPRLAGRPAFARVERIAAMPLPRRHAKPGDDPAANAAAKTRMVPTARSHRGRFVDLFV